MEMNDSGENLFFRNCRQNLPIELCIFANSCGLISTTLWFFVLIPQIYYNFKRRSVEGLSFIWALSNFTASLNNTFFVFKLGTLPFYSQINAVYMPILEGIILIQFLLFVQNSPKKFLCILICIVMWVTIVLLQVFLIVYQWLEWLSITLWSLETFPQIFLNIKRQSTAGLAVGMVFLTTLGKTTDFLSTYLLVMPLQYVVMCYFSSSSAFFVTLQVVVYWTKKRREREIKPTDFNPDESAERLLGDADVVPLARENFETKRSGKWLLCFIIVLIEICFAIGLILRTENFLSSLAPVVSCFIIGFAYCYYGRKRRFERAD